MGNHKKGDNWLKFSTPAIIAAFYLSLQFLIEFPVAFLLYVIQFTNDIVTSKLFVLLISQVICTAIFIVLIIPFLKVKDVEFNSISYTSFFTFITVFCLFWAIMIPITLGLSVISNNFDIEADIFENVLPLSNDHSGDLFSIILWLIVGTLGIAIFMEFLYRRTLIPLLEKRGMSPFSAVMTSSFAFALVNIPFNLGFQITILRESNLLNIYLSRYDLLNSLFYSLNLFITAFLLGIACGIVYILTRNILFSIMIHCFGLLPYYLMELFNNNIFLISFLGLLIIVMNISGLFIALYTLYSFFTSSSHTTWITILKKKSSVDINRGLVGFFIIFLGIIINIVVFIGLLAEHAPIPVTLLFNIVFLGFCFKNLREDSMKSRPDADHHELKESADVS
ncbi:MAG: CPBP family glutamic-type intramembrane protease [Candidatus Hodarchaeales archaeon]|jgi:membrane protease YdiL (CAAX protease family)